MQSGVAEAVKSIGKEEAEPRLDLAQLFRDYYTRIYNYIRYRVNRLEDAEDLVGTIFEQAYTHRNKFNPEKGAFSTWLFRIAHNELVNYYRKHQSRSKWETGAEPPPIWKIRSPPSRPDSFTRRSWFTFYSAWNG